MNPYLILEQAVMEAKAIVELSILRGCNDETIFICCIFPSTHPIPTSTSSISCLCSKDQYTGFYPHPLSSLSLTTPLGESI